MVYFDPILHPYTFEHCLAAGRQRVHTFIVKLNNFSTNSHINSLPTLCYSQQESKPVRIKLKPIWPSTKCKLSFCYIPINTFSLVKIRLTHHNLYENRKISPRNQPYQSFSVSRSILHNILKSKGDTSITNCLLCKLLRKLDTFGAHRKQVTTAVNPMSFTGITFSIAIILMGKRELVVLLNLSSWCLVVVERLFLAVPWGCLRFVIVVFPDHTHLLF